MGKLSLKGLERLSEAATGSLSKHGELKTNTKIRAQIKKHVSSAREKVRDSAKIGQTALTKKQAVEIRKLFRSKNADNVLIAVELIDASEATQDDITDVLSSSVLSQLINTWDVAIWNSLAPLLNSYPNAKREFTELAEKRLQQKFESSYKQQDEAKEFLKGFYKDLTIPLALLSLKISPLCSPRLFNGLTELPDAAAESLSAHQGDLYLNGLTALSDAAAKSLSKHEGNLSLAGLTSLPDGPGHIALAESLSKQGLLTLYGLTSLSDAAAESLSNHKGEIDLHGLTALSDAAAESLSNHKGEIDLRGLTALSDAAAESLSKHETSFRWWHINFDNLPVSAAKILRDAGHGE